MTRTQEPERPIDHQSQLSAEELAVYWAIYWTMYLFVTPSTEDQRQKAMDRIIQTCRTAREHSTPGSPKITRL